jgi:hydrogenase nickel incorporation protein HypA/HybF
MNAGKGPARRHRTRTPGKSHMHEMSLAMAMVDQVEEAAGGHGHRTVSALRVRVGELAGVVPESLRFCFELACAGTVLDGAELVLESVPGHARCGSCGADWETGMPPRLNCPCCGGAEGGAGTGAAVELVAGRELQIVAVRWGDPAAVSVAGAEPDPLAAPASAHTTEA